MTEWYLHKESGTVYRAAHLEELQQWAEEGRVEAGDLLSQDRKNWQPATDVPGLGLDYMLLLADDQTYGPLHLMGLYELLQESGVSVTTPVRHVPTGEEKQAAEWLLAHLIEERGHWQAARRDWQTEQQALRIRLESAESLALRTQDTGDADQSRDANKWKQLYETEKAHRLEDVAKVEKQTEELKTLLHETLSDRDRQLYRASQAERKLKKLEESGDPAGESPADDHELQAAYDRLHQNYENALRQLEEKTKALAALQEEQQARSSETVAGLYAVREELAAEQERNEHMQQQLAQKEREHVELLRSFRDLNDRFIQLRERTAAAKKKDA
jgi:hypothetical protein